MATLVYSHDANGNRISGDLKALVDAVLAGDTIRIKVGSDQDGWGVRTFHNVYVRNGHVMAQSLQYNWNWSPDGKSIVLEPQTGLYIINFSTTGRTQRRVFSLPANSNDDLTYQMAMSWYTVN